MKFTTIAGNVNKSVLLHSFYINIFQMMQWWYLYLKLDFNDFVLVQRRFNHMPKLIYKYPHNKIYNEIYTLYSYIINLNARGRDKYK